MVTVASVAMVVPRLWPIGSVLFVGCFGAFKVDGPLAVQWGDTLDTVLQFQQGK